MSKNKKECHSQSVVTEGSIRKKQNDRQKKDEVLINGCPKSHALSQIKYIEEHRDEIIKFWEANKHKKGYVEIYISPDYKTYSCGFEFIEKQVRESSFKPLWHSDTETYALVHFLWEATFTQYKMALAIT